MLVNTKSFIKAATKTRAISKNNIILDIALVDPRKSTVTSTNIEYSITSKFISEKNLEDPFLISDIKNLLKAMKSFDEYTNFEITENTIKISSGKKSIIQKSMPVEEYPTQQDFSDNDLIKWISIEYWAECRNKISHATSDDNARYILYCYYCKDNRLVSTNGYKLSIIPFEFNGEYLLPSSLMNNLGLFDYKDGYFFHKDGYYAISDKNTTIVSKIVNGVYPDTKSIIPISKPEKIMMFNRKDYIESLEFLLNNGLKNEVNKTVKCHKNKLLYDKDSNIIVELDDCNEYPEEMYGYNAKYMVDMLKNQFTEESFIFEYRGKGSAFLIKDTNEDNGISLIMPILLDKE